MALDISKIIQYPAPESEYHRVEYPKSQVVIHHTASGGNSRGDIDYLNKLAGKVHVAFWIDRDGQIWQAFSSKYYAPHLGTPASTFKKFGVNNTIEDIHKHSIGIELDSWGWLTLKDGKYYSYTGETVKPENVVTFPKGFRGYKYYERYTDAQIAALKNLLIYLCNTYKISKKYNSDMWDVSANALRGQNGIYAHVSYRESGKWDAAPEEHLIQMLENLEKS